MVFMARATLSVLMMPCAAMPVMFKVGDGYTVTLGFRCVGLHLKLLTRSQLEDPEEDIQFQAMMKEAA